MKCAERRRGRRRRAATIIAVVVLGAAAHAGADRSPGSGDTPPPCQTPGTTSAALLYDLGNAHARKGEVGLAVLCYERARILAPGDPDVRANLNRVRAAAGLTDDTGSWLERHVRWANPNLLYWVGLVGLGMIGTGALLVRFKPARRRPGRWFVALGIPAVCIAGIDAAATWPVLHEAVVLHATHARASPVSGGEAIFPVPEGQLVQAADAYGGYALVRTGAGRAGWVAQNDLAPLTP